jgi:hypothetical protein
MGYYTKSSDKKSGDGLSITEWNDLSSAVAGDSGLTLALTQGDNVGIGTQKPAAKLAINGGLHVGGDSDPGDNNLLVDGKLEVGGNVTANNAFMGDVGHGDRWAGFGHSSAVSGAGYGFLQNADGQYTLINKKSGNGYIGFRVDNGTKMVILDNGKVGIGTDSPKQTLTVEGKWRSGKSDRSGLTYGGNLAIISDSPQIDFIDTDNNDWTIHVNSNRMYFIRQPWSADSLVLDGNGNVGIGTGTTSPSAKLEVKGKLKVSELEVTGDLTLANITVSVIPVGAIISYGGTTAPAGWLLCDGTQHRKSSYPALSNVLGPSFGASSVYFRVPDLRGRFLRGVDAGAGNDPDAGSRVASNPGGNRGDAVGSLQGDEFKRHTHAYSKFPGPRGEIASGKYWAHGGANTGSAGGSETRPKNVNVSFIIKT